MMSSTIQLVPEDCHNYEVFCAQGRCPLVSVCNEDCMFVWKAYYDSTKELPQDEEIEDLEGKIWYLEEQLRMADEKIEQLEAELNGDEE